MPTRRHGTQDGAPGVLSTKVQSNGKDVNAISGLLLVCLLLVLVFGGLGLAVSPLFFVLVVVLILAFGWGGYSRRGR